MPALTVYHRNDFDDAQAAAELPAIVSRPDADKALRRTNAGTNACARRIWNTDWLVVRKLSEVLLDQVKDHLAPGSVVVDLGCGTMPYRVMMEQLGIRYIGADRDGDNPDLRIDARGRVLLEAASADAVLSTQVLEHVRDLNAYCSEICRLLDEDGTLFLSTHGNWLYHPCPEDHRRWTRTGLVADLEMRGLIVHDLIPIVGPLATTTIFRSTGFAVFARRLPLVGGFLAGAIATVMNLRAVVEDMITPAQIRLDNACIYFIRATKAAA